MRTYKGHTYINLVTLGGLRAALAQVADLPDDTPLLHATDDANEDDSYESVSELEIAWWDGEVQCEEGDEDAVKALFL
ncbi:hypothetical protein AB0C10_36685 [Microbispora amethystogenes]|uniref:hypothetical protein n=1 Tax=Microbispora amethystogenes TaxID=1427754 RepID=UPI0033EA9766